MKNGKTADRSAPVTIVATVGPALAKASQIRAVARMGRIIFRVNGAHGSIEDVGGWIERVRHAVPSARILLDLPGRKVRVTGLAAPLSMKRDEPLVLDAAVFNHSGIPAMLEPGGVLLCNDGRVRLRVVRRNKKSVTVIPSLDGVLGIGKGVHIGAALSRLPLFGRRDRELLARLRDWPVTHIGLSFVCGPADVLEARREFARRGARVEIVSKIETAAAMTNLHDILASGSIFMLDRGDLASEIGLEHLADAQEHVLSAAAAAGVSLIVATQLLKTMEENPIPFIAELTELHRLLSRGIFGLQLSEETAIGRYPLECVDLILKTSKNLATGVNWRLAGACSAPATGRKRERPTV